MRTKLRKKKMKGRMLAHLEKNKTTLVLDGGGRKRCSKVPDWFFAFADMAFRGKVASKTIGSSRKISI